MLKSQLSLLPILNSHSFYDLIYSLDLRSGWLDDILGQHLVWLSLCKIAAFTIYYLVIIH
jgi:hypothetical protein